MASSRFGAVVRQFSTSAVRAKLVKAPIQVYGLEGRYAHALFSAASKEKSLDKVEKELKDVQNLIKGDTALADQINDPSFRKKAKTEMMVNLLSKKNCSNVTVNLFTTMIDNGRINKIDSVLNAFGKIMSAYRGEVVCTVTTAKALDAANLKELQTALQGFLKKGETLYLETKVDSSLIGGMIVNIGDKYVDMSMSTKIKTYTNLIKEAV